MKQYSIKTIDLTAIETELTDSPRFQKRILLRQIASGVAVSAGLRPLITKNSYLTEKWLFNAHSHGECSENQQVMSCYFACNVSTLNVENTNRNIDGSPG